jgi:hypothetical protein
VTLAWFATVEDVFSFDWTSTFVAPSAARPKHSDACRSWAAIEGA